MRESEVKRYQMQFEGYIESWKMFGTDLIDAGSPNPCSRSPAARACFHGRWKEAYDMWLADGEFSTSEEVYVGFILATEAIFHKRPSAKVPQLPKRIWSDAAYKKAIRWYTEDIPFRNKTIASLVSPGHTEWVRQRQTIGALVKACKSQEAERLFFAFGWDQMDLAESNLALIRTCHEARTTSEGRDAMWFCCVGGRRSGPIPYEKLKAAFQQGRLLGTCLLWTKGMSGWKRATEVKCFAGIAYDGPLPPPIPKF